MDGKFSVPRKAKNSYFLHFLECIKQCLGSGSVGSTSKSAKICGSTDPDSRGKTQNINQKLQKKIYSQNPNLNYSKKRLLNGSSSLSIKISEKTDKKFENFALLKKFSKF